MELNKLMKLPMEIVESVLHLYRRYEEPPELRGKKIAIFDLDNTLIHGDIGEAVFAQLIADGLSLSFTPDVYRVLLELDRQRAYEECIRAMEYVPVESVIEATRTVMNSYEKSLNFGGEFIPVPRPNMLMKELVRLLRFLDFTTYVVSASNDISVKMIAAEWFGIPPANAWGIKSVIIQDCLTGDIEQPVPVGEGKVPVYHLNGSSASPAIVATDSVMDLPLLQLCDPKGMVFLIGENEELAAAAKEKLPATLQIQIVPSIGLSDFNLHSSISG